MERVAFLIEKSGERLGCLLNPQNVTLTRRAGLRSRRSLNGVLNGRGMADDPLLYTGGGRTELLLNLLFDVSLSGSSIDSEDVRDMTGPLVQLAENSQEDDRYGRPPHVRFIWGKNWNVPGIVAAAAERLEDFTRGGQPRRSWLRIRLIRCTDDDRKSKSQSSYSLSSRSTTPTLLSGAPTAFGLSESRKDLFETRKSEVPVDQIQLHEIKGGAVPERVVGNPDDSGSAWGPVVSRRGSPQLSGKEGYGDDDVPGKGDASIDDSTSSAASSDNKMPQTPSQGGSNPTGRDNGPIDGRGGTNKGPSFGPGGKSSGETSQNDSTSSATSSDNKMPQTPSQGGSSDPRAHGSESSSATDPGEGPLSPSQSPMDGSGIPPDTIDNVISIPDLVASGIKTSSQKQSIIHELASRSDPNSDDTPSIQGNFGERLDQVAYEYYRNPAGWRLLSYFNSIPKPLHIRTGQTVEVPMLGAIKKPQ